MTESELAEAVGKIGPTISVKLITDRDTGRGKGFGFVEMENEDDAEAAVAELDGKELFGRTLKVDIAKDRPPRSGGGQRDFNRSSGGERNFNR